MFLTANIIRISYLNLNGKCSHIKFDFSAIHDLSEPDQGRFEQAVRGDIFTRVSYGFSSCTKYEGEFCERVTITKDGYEFSFHIRQYERDGDHDFEIVDPDALGAISEDETLGRVVWLTIKPLG
jgi:hypothetical protein